jgi:hypothetical protein
MAPDLSGPVPEPAQNRPARKRWKILIGSRLWPDLRLLSETTRRLGQGGGANPSGSTPAWAWDLVGQADRLSSATLTPGPMVELTETFFR